VTIRVLAVTNNKYLVNSKHSCKYQFLDIKYMYTAVDIASSLGHE